MRTLEAANLFPPDGSLLRFAHLAERGETKRARLKILLLLLNTLSFLVYKSVFLAGPTRLDKIGGTASSRSRSWTSAALVRCLARRRPCQIGTFFNFCDRFWEAELLLAAAMTDRKPCTNGRFVAGGLRFSGRFCHVSLTWLGVETHLSCVRSACPRPAQELHLLLYL